MTDTAHSRPAATPPQALARWWTWLTATPRRRERLGLLLGLAGALALADPVSRDLAELTGPLGVAVMRRLSVLGDSSWMLAGSAAIGLWAWHGGRTSGSALMRRGLDSCRDRAWTVLAVVAITGIAASLLKLAIGRPRPKMAEAAGIYGFEPFAFDFKYNSFPSGHATSLFALACVLIAMAPALRLPILAVAAAAAASRVMVGAHYVADVVAGAALGYGGAGWLLRWQRRLGLWPAAFERPAGPVARAALRRLARRTGRLAAARIGGGIDGLIARGAALRRRRSHEGRGG